MIAKKRVKRVFKRAEFDAQFPYNIVMLFSNPHYFVRKNLYKQIKENSEYLKGSLLDFGCGCKPYEYLFHNCKEYIGLDIENEGHSHKNEKVDVFYDGKRIPFEDERFDSVFSSEVFEHVTDLEPIIEEIYRVLKKGGVFFVTVPFVWNEHEMPHDYRRLTQNGIIQLLKKSGFEIIKANRSTGYIEMISQMKMEYIRSLAQHQRRFLRELVQAMLCFPMAIFGSVISSILPSDPSLYGDNVIICKKHRH